jgi:hypothetical protein
VATYTVVDGDRADLKSAIEGGLYDVIEVPKGNYDGADDITLSRGDITIVGEGPSNSVVRITADNAVNCLKISTAGGSLSNISIRDLGFSTTVANPSNVLDGIAWDGTASTTLTLVAVQRCGFSGKLREGLRLAGADAAHTGTAIRLEGLSATGSRKAGIRLDFCTAPMLYSNRVTGCNSSNGTAVDTDAQVLLKSCGAFSVVCLDVETLPTNVAATKTGLCLSACYGGDVLGYACVQGGTTFFANSIMLNYLNGSRGVTWRGLNWSYITTPVGIDNSTRGQLSPFNGSVVQLAPSTAMVDALQP